MQQERENGETGRPAERSMENSTAAETEDEEEMSASTSSMLMDRLREQELLAQLVEMFVKELRVERVPMRPGRELMEHAKKRINTQHEKIRRTIVKSKEAWQRKKEDLPFCRFIDKVAFCVGVLGSLFTALLIGRPVYMMVNWYTFVIFSLVSIRMYSYRRRNWSSYLFDFCYFVQVLVLCYLYAFPNSGTLFIHVFGFANGPLPWAIPLWRNSLVFHDFDKLTSMAIHFLPLVLTYQLRWFPDPAYNTCDPASFCELHWYSQALSPLVPYLLWQIAYLLKTETRVLRVTKTLSIAEDEQEMTSYKYMQQSNGIVKRLLDRPIPLRHRPPRFLRSLWSALPLPSRQIQFCLLQLLYTFLALLLTVFTFRNFVAHSLFIFLITCSAVWNGASFYVEIFSSRYKNARVRATMLKAAHDADTIAGADQTEEATADTEP